MIKMEIKTPAAVVRVHDDFCQLATDRQMESLSRIVSDAYRRTQLAQTPDAARESAI